MADIDRRSFVGAGTLGVMGLLADGRPRAQESTNAAATTEPVPDVTRLLAAYVVNARPDDLPARVRAEACRTLLNWAGCTVGGSRHETVDIAVRALTPFS